MKSNLDIEYNQCMELMQMPLINPVTKMNIDPSKKTFQTLKQICKSRYNVDVKIPIFGQLGITNLKDQLKNLRKRLQPIKDNAFPTIWLTHVELIENLEELIEYIEPRKGILENYETDILNEYKEFYENIKEIKSLPSFETAYVSNITKRTEFLKKSFSDLLRKVMKSQPLHKKEIEWLKEQFRFHIYLHNTNEQRNSDFEEIKMLSVALEDMHQLIIDINDERLMVEQAKLEGIGDSSDRSPPTSLSQTTPYGRSRKYRTIRSNSPNSNSYHRHSKLSKTSPLPAATSNFQPLPQGTRQELLKGLRNTCRNLTDFISLKGFGKMRKRSLQLIAKVAPDKDKKYSCYHSRNLYRQWVSDSEEKNIPRDPLTRRVLTNEELDRLLQQVRYLNPEAKDPRTALQNGYKRLTLRVTAEIMRMPNNANVVFYHLTVMMNMGMVDLNMIDLGYIPAMVPEDFTEYGNPTTYSSSVLITELEKAFNEKRLMATHTAPYSCCKIHLMKSHLYWYDPDDPTSVRQDLFKKMIDEIEQLNGGFSVIQGGRGRGR